jgi:hypothetical protein
VRSVAPELISLLVERTREPCLSSRLCWWGERTREPRCRLKSRIRCRLGRDDSPYLRAQSRLVRSVAPELISLLVGRAYPRAVPELTSLLVGRAYPRAALPAEVANPVSARQGRLALPSGPVSARQ